MSRYELKPKDPNHEVVIGWDKPLNTYFLQVFVPWRHTVSGEDEFLVWAGFRRDELRDVHRVRALIEQYAEWPDELEVTLQAEQVGVSNPNVVRSFV